MPSLSNPRHEQFAGLIATGMRNSQAAIALGYKEKNATVAGSRLAGMDKIRQRVQELQAIASQHMVKHSIAVKDDRVKAQQLRWEKMHRVIDARAADPEMQRAPGGETGLLVKSFKTLGSGPLATVVEEYEVDTGLLAEMRKTEEHVAHELGQWVEGDAVAALTAVMSFGDVNVYIGAPGIGAQPAAPQVIDVDVEPLDVGVVRAGNKR